MPINLPAKFIPYHTATKETIFNPLELPMGDGYAQRSPGSTSNLERWTLEFKGVGVALGEECFTFFTTWKARDTVRWQPPDRQRPFNWIIDSIDADFSRGTFWTVRVILKRMGGSGIGTIVNTFDTIGGGGLGGGGGAGGGGSGGRLGGFNGGQCEVPYIVTFQFDVFNFNGTFRATSGGTATMWGGIAGIQSTGTGTGFTSIDIISHGAFPGSRFSIQQPIAAASGLDVLFANPRILSVLRHDGTSATQDESQCGNYGE